MLKRTRKNALILFLSVFSLISVQAIHAIEEHWNWDLLPDRTSEEFAEKYINLPKDFKFGGAGSDMQYSGLQTVGGMAQNSWTQEPKRPQPGIGNGFWDRFEQDIQLLKEAGNKTQRISVEWAKIQPDGQEFKQEVMDCYKKQIKALNDAGIKPVVCLFHHTWPTWFMEKGAFETAENGADFKKYGHFVHDQLKAEGVEYWMTYNEPAGVVLSQYLIGKLPPSRKGRLWLAGQVLKNMYSTHVELAHEIKAQDDKAKFMIAHVMEPLHPYHDYNPLEQLICKQFGYLNNELTIDYFTHGKFNWLGLVTDENKKAPSSIDIFGLNYYSHTVIKQNSPFEYPPFALSIKATRPEEIKIGRGTLYAEGLKECIEKAKKVGKPIWITENGVDTAEGVKDKKMRTEYVMRHLYVISQAIAQGADIQEYHWWTPIDSFSWSSGNGTKKYGLYKVDFKNGTLERKLRKDAIPFVNLMRKHAGMPPFEQTKNTKTV